MKYFIVEKVFCDKLNHEWCKIDILHKELEWQIAAIELNKIHDYILNDSDYKITYWDSMQLVVEIIRNANGIENQKIIKKYQII